MFQKIDDFFKTKGKNDLYKLSFILLIILAILDYGTGYEFNFFIFYGIPISILSWYNNKKSGYAFALLSFIIWIIVDHFSGRPYSHFLIPIWNGFSRLIFFTFVAFSLNTIKEKINLEELNANYDSLTGILNGRGFRNQTSTLMPLLKRDTKPYTLTFIDVDNFKTINDTMGHAEGDRILKKVAQITKTSLRNSDITCRMGGDEFVIFLPQTNQDQAQTVLKNLKENLDNAAKEENWPIGFSIGAGTFDSTKTTIEDGIKMSDSLMYNAKKEGKGRIVYSNMIQTT